MKVSKEVKIFACILAVFLGAYFIPFTDPVVRRSGMEALLMLQEYARQHVLLCLVPAFFIAGAIAVFISQASVIKYLGAGARKVVAYGVASVSGAVLAVCSCSVLPLFAGIYKRGAGLGPAIAFLYSGPAINILAIILTARILGIQLGLARAIGAVVFAVVIGLLMHLFFRREEEEKLQAAMAMPEATEARPLWKTAVYIAVMIAILVFANWGKPGSIEIHTSLVKRSLPPAPAKPAARSSTSRSVETTFSQSRSPRWRTSPTRRRSTPRSTTRTSTSPGRFSSSF